MQEKGDAFDAMVESESRIRLGEEGWKGRYYQVLPVPHSPPRRFDDVLTGDCWPYKPAAVHTSRCRRGAYLCQRLVSQGRLC